MMIVVAILAVLASAAFPLAQVTAQRQREEELRLALRQIRNAIDTYKQAYDEGRMLKRAGASGYPRDLDELVKGVEDATTPEKKHIYFLRRLPRDPMATDASVPAAETWGLRSYASPPDAPMEGEDVYDVYSRSQAIGLNGVPYREW
jgi:general secretion pathway protein G